MTLMGRPKRPDPEWPICAAPGCASPAATSGLCMTHDSRRRRGRPLEQASVRIGQPSGHGEYGRMTADLTGSHIRCHECGRWFQTLGNHLPRKHELTSGAYRDLHGLAASEPLMAPHLAERVSAHSIAQIGSPAWQRFASRRDATIAESQKLAAAVGRTGLRDGARAKREATGSRMAAIMLARRVVSPLLCSVCGEPVPAAPVGRRSHRSLCAAHSAIAVR